MKMRNKIVYLAGKYSGDSKIKIINRIQSFFNTYKAYKIAKKLWNKNIITICPHSNSFWMDNSCDYKIFLNGYIEVLKKCDFIYMLPNWMSSNGAILEHKFALQNDIEIFYNIETLIEYFKFKDEQ